MHRRRGVQIGLVAVLLLFGTLGTAGARQVWNESNAHAGWQAAQAAVAAGLRHARTIGLEPAQLAPLVRSRNRLQARSVPTANTLWSSARADFYTAQTRSYRSLDAAIRSEIGIVTRTTRAQALAGIARLNRDINEATALHVDTGPAARTLSTTRTRFRTSSTPAAYRAVAASALSASVALERANANKQRRVNAILRQSRNSAASIRQVADAAVQGVQDQLNLLALFTKRAVADRSQLQRLVAAVHSQPDARSAAVAEIGLEDEIGAIRADAAKTVPGKLILVSTEDQMAYMYQKGEQVYSTPVTTGGPELPTDHGIFHIYLKESPFVFHSPWPPGSPYYYPPTPVTFWMPFDGAEGLHDASWRSNFGPGSNLAPTDLGTGNYILGTHGCVNLPYDAAQFVWDWAPVGTTVVVV